MTEYRSGHFPAAEKALTAAEQSAPSVNDENDRALISGTTDFYRAMSLFHLVKHAEARTLLTAAESNMKPFPQ